MSVVPFEMEFVGGEPPRFNHKRWLTIVGLIIVGVVVIVGLAFVFTAGIIFVTNKPVVKGNLKTILVSNSTNLDQRLAVRAGVGVVFVVPHKLKVVPKGATYTLVTYSHNKMYTGVSKENFTIGSNNFQDLEVEFQVNGVEKPSKDNIFWFVMTGEYDMVEKLAVFPAFPYTHISSKFKCEFAVSTTEPNKPYSKTCYTVNEDDPYSI